MGPIGSMNQIDLDQFENIYHLFKWCTLDNGPVCMLARPNPVYIEYTMIRARAFTKHSYIATMYCVFLKQLCVS